jgi:pimeloyl-ACP methyl ester carboxylesterase
MKKDYFLGLSEEGFHRVAYLEWGKGNDASTPVICVHGLTRNSRDFDALAEYLSKRNDHVFCPDIVGRGDSDWLNNPLHYTYEQYIADMVAMIARTDAARVDWVGTSMGGLIGMILASMPKSPIRRLVLNDVGPQIPAKGLARLAKYAGREPVFNNINEAVAYYKKIYAEFGVLTDEQWLRFAENSVREITPGRFISKLDQGIKVAPAKSNLAWRAFLHPHKALEGTLFDMDLWHIWRKVTCPVLVLHGKNSDILLPSVVEKMRRIHPDTEVIEIENAGHAPALLDPKEHEMIYRFLMQV